MVEVILLSPFAILIIVYMAMNGQSVMFDSSYNMLMLLGCGPVTAIPLILYAYGAKGLRLSTIGLMQYIVPSFVFLIGVFIFKEPFSNVKLIAFILIWIALIIYSWSTLKAREHP